LQLETRLKETVLGKEHPDILGSINNLALVLSDQGKYEEAGERYRQALRLYEAGVEQRASILSAELKG